MLTNARKVVVEGRMCNSLRDGAIHLATISGYKNPCTEKIKQLEKHIEEWCNKETFVKYYWV